MSLHRRNAVLVYLTAVLAAVGLLAIPVTAAATPQVQAAPGVAGAFGSVDPVRLLDTRTGNGAPKARLQPGASITVGFLNRGGLPTTGVSTVVASLTVVSPSTGGTLAIAPANAPTQRAVVINFAAKQGISNTAFLPLSSAGQVVFTNVSGGTIDLVADVTGYYRSGTPTLAGTYGLIAPVRLIDTRTGNGAPKARIAPGTSITVKFTGRGGIPTSGVSTAVAALTVVNPSAGGTLSVAPAGNTTKRAVVINFAAKHGISSTAMLPIGSGGQVVFTNNSAGTIDLVADTTGYYRAGTAARSGTFGPVDPIRLLDTRTGNGAPKARLAAGQSITVSLPGRGNLPGTGITAVTAAVTVVSPTAGGTLAVAPGGATGKRAVIINFAAKQGISTTSLLPIGAGGRTVFTNVSGGTIDIVADVTGSTLDIDTTATPTWGTPTPVYKPVGELTTVSCVNVSFCMASDGARSFRFNGDVWTTQLGRGFSEISCSSTTFCIGVKDGRFSRWNGTTWTTPAAIKAGETTVDQVSCAASTCVAISTGRTAYRYSGGTWTASTIGATTTTLQDISCASAVYCMAVDTNGRYMKRTSTGWSAPAQVWTASITRAVDCTSVDFCVVVGIAGLDGSQATEFNGTTWSTPTRLGTADEDLVVQDVSCFDSVRCMAVGYATPQIWDGESWTASDAGTSLAGFSVDCFSHPGCIVQAALQVTFWSDGQVGDGHQLVTSDGIVDVSCAAADCLVVAEDGGAVKYSGGTVTQLQDGSVVGVDCLTATYCVGVGGNLTSGSRVFDGLNWTDDQILPMVHYPTDVSCTSTSFCMAINRQGNTAVDRGTGWTDAGTIGATAGDITSVECVSATRCYATIDAFPDGGGVVTWNGTSWSAPVELSAAGGVIAISCPDAGFCVAVGQEDDDNTGYAAYFEDTVWSAAIALPSSTLGVAGVSCASRTFCGVTDDLGQVSTFNGATWSTPVKVGSADATTNAISCWAIGSCAATNGSDGSLTTTN
ncbi:hypothetical protein [Nakamurella alba]|uniref:hypothetical protein n=1 Tax=Nakamurella alba TaxID=2665158 RepID=UPI0018A911EC|nr:hypothetical protein [Nakamurella alba]